MARIHILADPPSDAGNYLHGSWLPSLPLANLADAQPKRVARSRDASAAATRFICDLGRAQPLDSFALIGSNLSPASTVRIRVYEADVGADPVLDATMPGFPPNVAFGALSWGQFPWDGYRNDPLPAGQTTFYRAPESVFGRYVVVHITDTANPAGYVQVGRFMAGSAFVPRYNFGYGAGFSFVDPSRVSQSVGGQKWFDRRPKYRRFRCGFEHLTEGEAWGAIYDMQRRIGLSGNLLLIYDPDDSPDVLLRRTIYGAMTALEDIVTANASVDAPYTWTLNIEELI